MSDKTKIAESLRDVSLFTMCSSQGESLLEQVMCAVEVVLVAGDNAEPPRGAGDASRITEACRKLPAFFIAGLSPREVRLMNG
jgi:hypothetical protein